MTTPVRYIRDTLRDDNHRPQWVELQALNSTGTNVANNAPVSINFTPEYAGTESLVTDGVSYNTNQNVSQLANATTPCYVSVDLGAVYDIASITVWHYYGDSRIYARNYTEISTDGTNWTMIFDTNSSGTYTETGSGRTMNAPFTAIPTVTAPTFASAVADNINGGNAYITFTQKLYDWTQANATHGAPPISAFNIVGHTFSNIVVDSNNQQVALRGVSPLFGASETLSLTYTAPSDGTGIYEVTGSLAAASFGPVSISNNVAATTSAPTAPTITNITPSVGSLTVEFNPPTSDGGSAITSYTVYADSFSATGTSSPLTVSGLTNNVTYSVTVTATNSTGTSPASASQSGTPGGATTASYPIEAGSLVKHIGTGYDFPDWPSFCNWVNGQDPVALGKKIYGIVEQNLDISNTNIQPINSDGSHYVTVQPGAGKGMKLTGALNVNSPGVVLTTGTNSNGGLNVSRGVKFIGLGIHIVDQTMTVGNYYSALQTGGGSGSFDPYFTECVIYGGGSASKNIIFGWTGVSTNLDNCLIVQSGPDLPFIYDVQSPINFRNCGFKRDGSYTSQFFNGYYGFNSCWAIGLGSQWGPSTGSWGAIDSCVADTAITVNPPPSGLSVASAFVVNGASATGDFTPTAGGALIGHANSGSNSTADIRGLNHGLSPDIGPLQLNPAPPLAVAAITHQPATDGVDGQTATISGTYSGQVDSISASIPAGSPANGAQQQGPVPVTFANGTWSIVFDNVPAGNYAAPTVLFTNPGGVAAATGGQPFSVNGVSGTVADTGQGATGGNAAPPPTVSISTVDTAVMMGQRGTLSGSFNLQGDVTGTLALFLDSQTDTTVITTNATVNQSGSTWTVQYQPIPVGVWKLRIVATANGQTATASTGSIRVLGLTGTPALPVP